MMTHPSHNYTVGGDPFYELCVKYDSQTPEGAILNACQALIQNSHSRGFSTDFNKLLNSCHSRVIEKNIAMDGRLEIEDNGYAIYVSKKQSEARKRFSIAHELGHILIIEGLFHKPKLLKLLRYHNYWKRVEHLCDLAASEILLPTNHFIEQIKKFGLNSESIDRICKYYGTSRDSFFVKFTNVFKPSAIVLCKSQLKTRSELAPSVVRIRSSLSPLPIREGPLKMNSIMRNLINATVKNGRAWSDSLIGNVNGKTTKIFRLGLLTKNSIHFKNKQIQTLDESEVIEHDQNNYDVMLFYLPLEAIPNSSYLMEAIQAG